MRIVMMAAGAAVLMAGTPALAQQAGEDVNSYLCTFAGKCGGVTTEATPVMAARSRRMRARCRRRRPAASGSFGRTHPRSRPPRRCAGRPRVATWPRRGR